MVCQNLGGHTFFLHYRAAKFLFRLPTAGVSLTSTDFLSLIGYAAVWGGILKQPHFSARLLCQTLHSVCARPQKALRSHNVSHLFSHS